MHYTIHQLQVLLKVAETGSITKAAEALHITQPAASIQLKKLQEQFQLPLIEQLGKQVYFTDFGKEILVLAQEMADKMNEINYKTHLHEGGLAGRLKLATVSTGKYVLPYFLTDFLREHSNVELSMDVTNKAGVINDIENNLADIALVSVLPDKVGVNHLSILENRLYFVGNTLRKFNTAAYDSSLFKELTLIYREKGSATRMVMEQFIEKKKITISKQLELTSNEAVKQALLAGLGYSIMPLIGIRNELRNKELQIIPIKGLPVKSEWQLIWLKQKKLSPVAEAFIAFTRKNKQLVFNNNFSWTNNQSFRH